MISPRLIAKLLIAGIALSCLSGCAPLIAVGAVKTGTTVAQDRSFGRAVDDLTMRTQIQSAMAKQNKDLVRLVNVKVFEGRVLLTGSVPKQEDRIAAVRATWTVPHVREVGNEIRVSQLRSFGRYLRDLRISDRLRAKLMTDRAVAWVNYNVQTVDGTVYLMGVAKNGSELQRVTSKARTIHGVKKVVSYVQLKDDPERVSRL
jgi:osmotically-inducible protein OsmY